MLMLQSPILREKTEERGVCVATTKRAAQAVLSRKSKGGLFVLNVAVPTCRDM